MSTTDSQVLLELIVDITNLSIFRKNEVDFFACFTNQGIKSIGFSLGLLPLLTEISPFFFFRGELFDFLSNFVIDFFSL